MTTDDKKKLERISRQICPGNIRRGRRVLHRAISLFRRKGIRFTGFERCWNRDAIMFIGEKNGKRVGTYLTHHDAVETRFCSSGTKKALLANLQI